jgi:DNA polymerase I
MSNNKQIMQIIDIDYYVDNNQPIIRIFGKDDAGKSTCCFVPGFEPYFYARADNPDELCNHLIDTFECIKKTEIVEKFLPVGYQTKKVPIIKITVTLPTDVKEIRDQVLGISGVHEIFEADVLFHNRFLIDKNLHPLRWISVTVASEEKALHPTNILCERIITAESVEEIDRISHASFKYVAWDIECLPDNGAIPTPDKSPIILMSMAFSPEYKGMSTLVLASKPIPNTDQLVQCLENENDMINQFFSIIREYDPDVITGFNTDGFDTKYVVDRSKKINTEAGNTLINTRIGRDGREFNYRVFGTNTSVSIPGRIVADVLPIIRGEFKLKRYKLENVAKELIGKEKLDVPPQEMEAYWNDPEKIYTFIDYSRRDSELALELLLKLQLLDKYLALAQVSGRPIQDAINGGQTNLVEQLLMSRFREIDRLMAMKPDDEIVQLRQKQSDELVGADVLEPQKGLHCNTVVLDYKSLYPTIMMARNLCYTTVITDKSTPKENMIISPSGGHFIKPEIFKGTIPIILEELLDKRVETKKMMKNAGDANERRVLDATQLALKILLNSFYGYSGYARARLFSLNVANSVTSYGRENIRNTENTICNEIVTITIRNDQALIPSEIIKTELNDKVVLLSPIYGDTDSIFIHCIDINGHEFADEDFTLEMSALVGKKIAEVVTSKLPEPMELQYEATAKRILLVAKKRYAMWQFEQAKDGWIDKIKVKGLETVRRDWCNLTSKTLNFILEAILKEGNVEKCITYVQGVISKIRKINDTRDKELIAELTMSKTLSRPPSSYKNKQPHLTVVEKIKVRGGQVPIIGERVPFLVTTIGSSFVDQAEDPTYVLDNNIPLDTDYYIHKQIIPPALRLLETFGVEKSTLDIDTNQKGLFDFGKSPKPEKKAPIKKTIEPAPSSVNEKSTKSQKSLFDF